MGLYVFEVLARALHVGLYIHDFCFCRYIWGAYPPPLPNTKKLATLLDYIIIPANALRSCCIYRLVCLSVRLCVCHKVVMGWHCAPPPHFFFYLYNSGKKRSKFGANGYIAQKRPPPPFLTASEKKNLVFFSAEILDSGSIIVPPPPSKKERKYPL